MFVICDQKTGGSQLVVVVELVGEETALAIVLQYAGLAFQLFPKVQDVGKQDELLAP